MAQNLVRADQRAAKLSLPEAVTSRLKWLGTVEGRKYLSSGLMPLTMDERAIITRQRLDIEDEIQPRDGDDKRKITLLAEMMMALAGGAIDASTVQTRQFAYSVGLRDVPAWVLREALDQWYGGRVTQVDVTPQDYKWPPSPGVLAIICRSILQPYHDAVEKLNLILTVKPLDDTLKELHRGAA